VAWHVALLLLGPLLDHSSGRSSSCALLLLGLLCQQDGAEAVEAAPDQGEGDAA